VDSQAVWSGYKFKLFPQVSQRLARITNEQVKQSLSISVHEIHSSRLTSKVYPVVHDKTQDPFSK